MKDNDKFLKPGAGKPVPMPMKPGKGDEKPGAFIKPLPVRPGIKPVKPGKPKPTPGVKIVPNEQLPAPSAQPKIAAIEAMRKKQASK